MFEVKAAIYFRATIFNDHLTMPTHNVNNCSFQLIVQYVILFGDIFLILFRTSKQASADLT